MNWLLVPAKFERTFDWKKVKERFTFHLKKRGITIEPIPSREKSLVVITGASHGIGKALAIKFANDGYPCLLLSRHIQPFPELNSKNVVFAQIDVTDFNAFQSAVEKAEKKFGKTECLINSAGLIHVGEFSLMPLEKCAHEIDVLFKGVMNGVKIVLPQMANRKSGTIINISSMNLSSIA